MTRPFFRVLAPPSVFAATLHVQSRKNDRESERALGKLLRSSLFLPLSFYLIYISIVLSRSQLDTSRPPQLERLFAGDGYLTSFEGDLLLRWSRYATLRNNIIKSEGSLAEFATGYNKHGLRQLPNGDIEYLEWVSTCVCIGIYVNGCIIYR